MKKTICVFVLLALVACGGANDQTTSVEDQFIADVQLNYEDEVAGVKETIDLGYSICEELKSGSTFRAVASLLVDSAGGDPDAKRFYAATLASAVINLCPDQRYKLDEA